MVLNRQQKFEWGHSVMLISELQNIMNKMKTWQVSYLVELLPVPVEGFEVNNNLVIKHGGEEEDVSLALVCARTKEKVVEPLKGVAYTKEHFTNFDKARNEALATISLFLGSHALLHLIPPRIIRELPAIAVEENEPLCQNAKDLLQSHTIYYNGISKAQSKQELEESTNMFNKITSLRTKHKYLAIAMLMYYRGASTYELLEDFIDLITAMEALYVAREQSKGHVIAKRASAWLFNQLQSSDTYTRLRDLYRLRNKIVHGKNLTVQYDDKFFLEGIVRQSLKKFIALAENGMSKKQILAQMDKVSA